MSPNDPRMAAIANLGRIAHPADPADRAFLESIDASSDSRVAHAVRRALASLR